VSNASRILGLCLSLIFLGCATGTGAVADDPSPSTATAAGVPIFQVVDIMGEEFDLQEHIGKDVVFISFWATWCEPCKTEMPLLQRLHEDYGEKGLKILSVSLDGPESVARVEPYIQTQGYTFQVVIDSDTSIAQAINPRAVAPFTMMIGRDGLVAKTIEGFQLSESEHIIAEVRRLLGLEG
jgi:peroxiredoxin